MSLRLLRPVLLVVMLAPLGACVHEQRHQLYACNSGPKTTASQVIVCMSREGYRADFGAPRCRDRTAPYNVAICYRPRGLIAGIGFILLGGWSIADYFRG